MSEQISNGGWENDWTDWTHDGFSISTSDPHGGAKHLWGYSVLCYVEQTLATSIKVSQVDSFVIWVKCGGYFGGLPDFTLKVYYTDATSTSDNIAMAEAWTEIDLIGYLTAGKTIEKIRIEYHNSNWWGQFDDISLTGTPCETVLIKNTGGSLCCNPIEWGEGQSCKVAVRSIPTRSAGSFVDVGTYTLKNRRLDIGVRLTDANKTSLQAIFDASAVVTITAYGWTYTGWFVKKPVIWEYSKDGSGNERKWLADMEFVLSSFSYSP